MTQPIAHSSARGLVALAAALAALSTASAPAQAESVGTMHFEGQFGGYGVVDSLMATLGIGGVEGTEVSFFELALSQVDIGRSFTLSNGASFDAAVAYLTNGSNDLVSMFNMTTSGGAGYSRYESDLLFGDASGASGIDLAGHPISSMVFTVNELRFDSYGGSDWTDTRYDYSVSFNAVPELATAAMLALGLACLGASAVSFRRR